MRQRANKKFEGTPNTPQLSAHAFGIVAQKAIPYSAPLYLALVA